MDSITHHDVIRAIERYYDGDLYNFEKKDKRRETEMQHETTSKEPSKEAIGTAPTTESAEGKEINLRNFHDLFPSINFVAVRHRL